MSGKPPGKWSSDSGGARGFLVSVGSLASARAFLALSQILVLPIMARQLSIEDFAVMALAMTAVIFAQTLSDSGLGRSLIRASDYDHEEWSSVFWLMVAVGVGLALITAALGPVMAWFYDEPRLTGLLVVLSIVPFVQAISAAPNAEIERREKFNAIARVQMTTTTVSLALAVGLALAGAGVWALVAQQLALAIVRLVGIVRLSTFRPTLVFRTDKLGHHLVFARDTIYQSFLATLRRQFLVMIIGRVLDPIQVGYYAMSQRFGRLAQFGIAGPMTSIVYVRMAKARGNPERLSEIYLGSMRVLSLVLIVPMAMLAAGSGPIFALFLGEEWRPVAPIFALSIGGLVLESIVLFFLSCLFRALSRTDRLVRITFEGMVVQIVLGLSAFHSIEAVAFSMTLWSFIMVPRGWQMARQLIPLRYRDAIGVLVPGLITAAVAIVIYWQLVRILAPSDWGAAGLAILLGVAGLGLEIAIDWKGLRRAVGMFRSDEPPAPPVRPVIAE